MKKFNANFVYFATLFFTGSIFGFLWEMIAFKYTHRGLSCIVIIQKLRGVLHGPWVPIYGFGFVLLVLLGLNLKRKPIGLFAGNIAVCGLLEYITSYVLELFFHARWWDYSTKFLNLHGRIYIGGLLFFGLAGMVVVYCIEPWMHSWIGHINPRIKTVFISLLVIIFCIDVFVAIKSPNLGIGVSIMEVQ